MNRVIHFEIQATNPEKIIEFYRSVFGWEIRKWDNPDVEYWMVMTAPDNSKEIGIDGGLTRRIGPALKGKGEDPIAAFVCTVNVPSVDAYIKKIEKAGGKNIAPKMAIPGMAWIATCIDIEGNHFGLFEEDKNAK